MRKLRQYNCKNCKENFTSRNKDPKFCSTSCASKYNSSKYNFIKSVQEFWKAHPEKLKEQSIESQKGKHKKPKSILELSKRTISKICRRLQIGCSRCGWDKEICDIHHIIPKKQGGTDEHINLTYLCPNCHRLADRGHIKTFTNLQDFIKDKWKQYYYG